MSLPQKPIGKVTVVAGTSITESLPTTNTGQQMISKEIFRTRWIKVANKTNQVVVIRLLRGQQLDPATGEVFIGELLIDTEVNNYKEIFVDSGETVYLHKDPGQTPLDPDPADPGEPYIQNLSEGQQGEYISLLNAGTNPTTGNVYVSPIAVFG
jgi:hypothetical protein